MLALLLLTDGLAFGTDGPLELAGRLLQWLLNATVRRRRPLHDLPKQLLSARDFVRTTLGERWRSAVPAAAANSRYG